MSGPWLSDEWDGYLVALRRDAHQLLAWGFADTRQRLVAAQDEDELTGLLAEGMDARINSPETHEHFLFYAVHSERPTSPAGELGKKRPRLDIQIVLCGVRPRPNFTFEAKRLRDDANADPAATMRHYLGGDGIRRYVKGRYVSESREAAMLGLIQARDAGFWFAKVDEAFTSDAARGNARFALIEGLRRVSVIPDFPDERASVHARTSNGPIGIFHLFVDCR